MACSRCNIFMYSTLMFVCCLYFYNAKKMAEKSFAIEGMNCASCAAHVEKAAAKVEGITFASVNLATERLTISYDERKMSPDRVMDAVSKAGYRAIDDEKERRATR